MTLPIRLRLTAWYVLLLAVIVAGLGAFVVLRLRSDLTSDTDHRLATASVHIARAYAAEGVKDFQDTARTVLPRGDAFAEVLDANGRVLATQGTAAAGVRYRRRVATISRRGKEATLVTAESLAPVDRSVNRVLVLLAIGGGGALLVTACGGWWLARRGLRPVDRMTASAARIGAESLDQRLEVPRADDEVARLAVTLNGMLDRLERGAHERQRLVADASHELRGPLAVMRAELDVALGDPDLDGAARGVLTSARDEVIRMARLVDDMLALAALDEGRLELVQEPVDLLDLARGVARRSRASVAVEGESAPACGDALRLEHALSNLVDNAIKFGGGEVRVTTWRSDSEVGLAVADGGPGVSPGDRERIFDRFVRLDAARGRGGSGLGLAICSEVARAHGGRAWTDGERFAIAIPRARREELTAGGPRTAV